MSERRDAAVRLVVDAWTIPGPQPLYHRAAQIRLREQWPVLARAIEALVFEEDAK